jgi:hypothetical protein
MTEGQASTAVPIMKKQVCSVGGTEPVKVLWFLLCCLFCGLGKVLSVRLGK